MAALSELGEFCLNSPCYAPNCWCVLPWQVLLEGGLLHGDALTCTGQTLEQNLQDTPLPDFNTQVVKCNALSDQSGMPNAQLQHSVGTETH